MDIIDYIIKQSAYEEEIERLKREANTNLLWPSVGATVGGAIGGGGIGYLMGKEDKRTDAMIRSGLGAAVFSGVMFPAYLLYLRNKARKRLQELGIDYTDKPK